MLTPEQKKTAVDYLTGSIPAWKGGDAVLNALKDEQLVAVYNDQVRIQELDGVFNAVKEYLGDDTLTANAAPAAMAAKKCKCDEEMTENSQAAVEAELAKLPAVLRTVVTNAMTLVDQAKTATVDKIVANVGDEAAKTAAKAVLNKLQPADLEKLLPVAAAPVVNAGTEPVRLPARLAPLYLGAAGGGNPSGPTGGNTPAPTTNAVKPLGLPQLPADYWAPAKS